jgi:signal peptidase I
VIGLPGDHVRVVDRRVLVNGAPIRENYVIHTKPERDRFRDDFPYTDIPSADTEPRWWEELPKLVHNGELIVPPGRYFVMGDNRDESQDSRYWGCVPRENIIGRPFLIYWSVRAPRPADESSSSRGDKLSAFLYGVTHLVQDTRWDRAFRIVR